MMGHTLAEKIIMKNTGLADLHPGDLVTVSYTHLTLPTN